MNGPSRATTRTPRRRSSRPAASCRLTQFPQFESWPSARWDKPGGPFDPHTGEQYVYSQIADVSYKRLTRTVTVPAGGGSPRLLDVVRHRGRLGLRLRRGPHPRRRRLDDAARRQRPHHPGDRRELRGGLARAAPAARPLPDLRRGHRDLHADRHDGRMERRVRQLGRLAGVERRPRRLGRRLGRVVLTYASDWGTQGLGSFVDDVTLPDGTSTSFETGLEGWTVRGAGRERHQRQRLGGHRRRRLPRRGGHHDARLAAPRLRVRGHRDARRAQRGDGEGAAAPAGLRGAAGRTRQLAAADQKDSSTPAESGAPSSTCVSSTVTAPAAAGRRAQRSRCRRPSRSGRRRSRG